MSLMGSTAPARKGEGVAEKGWEMGHFWGGWVGSDVELCEFGFECYDSQFRGSGCECVLVVGLCFSQVCVSVI